MFGKLKEKITKASKETIKTELKNHLPEIISGSSVILLLYLCIHSRSKPINITITINGRSIC